MADERDVALAQLPNEPQQFLDALPAQSVDCPDDEHGELAAVRVIEHLLRMPLPLVSGSQRNRCPAAAREQVTVALAMIDGIEAQIAPLDKDLRAYAHRQAGCKA